MRRRRGAEWTGGHYGGWVGVEVEAAAVGGEMEYHVGGAATMRPAWR